MFDYLNRLYWQRAPQSVKGDFGKCLIIAGSKKYPGASFIACRFAELAGPGYVALAVPNSIYLSSINAISPNSIHELMSLDDDFFWQTGLEVTLNQYQAILFGNGINASATNLNFLENLLVKYEGNLVIDGTGLTLLAQNLSLLANKNSNLKILLTPHLGEATKLLKCDNSSRNPLAYLKLTQEFAYKYQVSVLLKSYMQILVLPSKEYLQSTFGPIPGLAKAGSGDALAGLITGFLAYAVKYYHYEEVIYQSDKLFHLMGIMATKKYSSGLVNSDVLKESLITIVRCAESHKQFKMIIDLIAKYEVA